MYQKNVQLEMKEQESKEEKGGVLFIKDSIKNMKKKSEKQALWGNILLAVMMVMAIFLPVSVHAEENTSETLTAGQETTFTYPAGNFSLEYVFTPEEDGVYDIQMALSDGGYEVSYDLMVDGDYLSGTSRTNQDSEYFLFDTHPMIKGTTYRIQLNATAIDAKEGTGRILISKSDAVLQEINYNGQENMTRNGYYYFTAPSNGKYQIEVSTRQGTVEADEWGRVSVYYGTKGRNIFTEFYQNQTVRTPGLELTAGESAIIELYYNTDKDFEGTIKVTDYIDNQLRAYVSGTQETEKVVYVPEGETATLSVTVSANDLSKVSYQWYKRHENESDEPIDGANDSSFTIGESPCELYCAVKDQYGNKVNVLFSVVKISGEITKGNSEILYFTYLYNTLLYKFTAPKSEYYTISTVSPEDSIDADIKIYDSEELNSGIPIINYGEEGFKGDIYLEEGQSIFILAKTYSQGSMELNVNSSMEMGYVLIDEETFPDANFRNYIKEEIDGNENDLLSPEEIDQVEEISVNYRNISSLQGISIFENLEALYCTGNQLDSLDVSHNTALKKLCCMENQLTGLDVSQNTALTILTCNDNLLTSLDITHNLTLKELYCYSNNMQNLDVSQNTSLEVLFCEFNKLTSLDVSNNTALIRLDCSGNQLTDLDVSNNIALKELYCDCNYLSSLDISSNIALEALVAYKNQLTSLNVRNNSVIELADCEENQKEVTVDSSNKYDLSTLPGNFDINFASNWCGGNINGNILIFTERVVTYTYDMGKGMNEIFTLIASNYNENTTESKPSSPSEEEPQPAVPDAKDPETVKPAVPQNPASSGAGESSDRGQLTAGMTVTDTKTKSAYTVSGSTADGYTVTYVRPSTKNVKNVTIPSVVTVNGVSCKVTSIAANAFKGQKKLKKVTIGGNVTSIGKKAFFGCKNLKKIVIKSKKLKKVQAKAFAKINQKAKIKVPKNKKKAYSKILKKNTGINKKMF